MKISIIKEENGIEKTQLEINSNGYILAYLQGQEVKVTGSISLKELAPILTKLVMSKLAG